MTAIAAAHARNELIDTLRKRHATNAASAVVLGELGALPKRQLEQLVKSGIVRESSPLHYFLDERSYREAEQARSAQVKWFLLLLLFLALVGLAFAIAIN